MEELAKEILLLKYGIGAACVLVTIYILLQMFKVIYDIKNKESDQDKDSIKYNTIEVQKLTNQMVKVNESLSKLPDIDRHLWRNFLAVKIIAGGKWDSVMEQIIKEEKLKQRSEEL